MATSNGEKPASGEQNAAPHAMADNPEPGTGSGTGSFATAALVLGGLALIQPELIPGMAVGAGVALLSPSMSRIVTALRPALKAAVKAAYTAAEAVAVATEEIEDLIAEARAEHEQPPVMEAQASHIQSRRAKE